MEKGKIVPMKNILVKALAHGIIFMGLVLNSGCKHRGCADSTACNYDRLVEEDDGTCDYSCNTCYYTQWTASGSCGSGYYPVYVGQCCGADYPYYNTATGTCYSTCEAAHKANPSGDVYRYNTNGGNSCDYTQWTGTGSCNSDYYPVYYDKCCGADYPYYNTATGYCYTTCEAAYNADSSGEIYRYNH